MTLREAVKMVDQLQGEIASEALALSEGYEFSGVTELTEHTVTSVLESAQTIKSAADRMLEAAFYVSQHWQDPT